MTSPLLRRAVLGPVLLLLVLMTWSAFAPSAFAQAPDSDGDGVADTVDDNDDNDALVDTIDPFALDRDNGLGRTVPLSFQWNDPASEGLGGLFNLGFTGLMANGADYLTQFDPAGVTVANGVVTVNNVDEGDAYNDPTPGSVVVPNTQRNGFQVGVKARPADGPFTVRTRIVGPFAGMTPQNFQSMGVFLGNGDQDNYVKITTAHVNGTVVQVVKEVKSVVSNAAGVAQALPGPNYVDLYLGVDPQEGTVQPSYVAAVGGEEGIRQNVGGKIFVPRTWFTAKDRGLAVGILSTSAGPGPNFAASWDYLQVTPGLPTGPVANPPTTNGGGGAQQGGQPGQQGGQPGGTDSLAPRITGLRLSSRNFAAVARRGRRAGADLRLTLSEAAAGEVRVYRRSTGRRVGGRCVRPTRANRRARTCVRDVRVRGSITTQLAAGANTIRISGRVGGKRLARGRYKLVVAARDAAGNRTTSSGLTFRITR